MKEYDNFSYKIEKDEKSGAYTLTINNVRDGNYPTLTELREIIEDSAIDAVVDEKILEKMASDKLEGKPVIITAKRKIDVEVEVKVSANKYKAYVIVKRPKIDTQYEIKDITNALESKGIVYGIHMKNIEFTVKNQLFDQEILAARARPPKKGIPAKIEYLVDMSKSRLPEVRENANVDLKELHTFLEVKKGDPLMRRVPPQDGEAGTNVYGVTVPPKPVKDIKIVPTKGTLFAEGSTDLIVAAYNGIPMQKGYSFEVLDTIIVEKDLDYSVGNIKFGGSVEIRGKCHNGFRIETEKDITVKGCVEAAFLTAGNNISISGEIIGQEHSPELLIKAGGNITAKYIENAVISAGGDISVQSYIMHSHLNAKSISITASNGKIIGGRMYAEDLISTPVAGSPIGVKTILEVGFVGKDAHYSKLKQALNTIDEWRVKLQDAVLKLGDIRQIPPEKRETVVAILKKLKTLGEDKSRIQDELNTIDGKLEKIGKAQIKVGSTLFSGVTIIADGMAFEVSDNINKKITINGRLIAKYIESQNEAKKEAAGETAKKEGTENP